MVLKQELNHLYVVSLCCPQQACLSALVKVEDKESVNLKQFV
jgi:hypothetical protein